MKTANNKQQTTNSRGQMVNDKNIKHFHILTRLLVPCFLSFVFCLLSFVPCLAAGQTDWQGYQKYGHRDSKWDGFVDAGFSAFDSGNLGTAEIFLQRAVGRGCNDGLVFAKIGLYHEAQTNYKKAAQFLRKAVKLLPGQYPNHEITGLINECLGRVLFLNDEPNEALPYLQKALSGGENFTALYFLGQIYKSKNDPMNAAAYFERALTAKHPQNLSPNVDILIMAELGKAYYDDKKFDISLEWWKKILALDPGNITARSYKDRINKQKFKEQEIKIIEEIVK